MHPLFTRSAETEKVLNLFRGMSTDAPMSFGEASKALGFEINSSSPAYNSARVIASRDHNIVIEGVRSFGFMRLTGSGIVGRGARHMKSIRRRSNRAAHEMGIAVSQNLSRDEMALATERMNRFKIIADLAQPIRAQTNKPAAPAPETEHQDNRAALAAITK